MISTTLMRMSKANRLDYMDWMRGLAVVVMIETHVFNSFLRGDLRKSDAYMIAQSIGGLAAPLFLFIAGIMTGFRIDKRDGQGCGPLASMLDIWTRSAYILCIAELILFQQYVSQWSFGNWRYLLRVDILNCMALAIAVSGIVALGAAPKRPGMALFLGAVIAGFGARRLWNRLEPHANTAARLPYSRSASLRVFSPSGVCTVRNGCWIRIAPGRRAEPYGRHDMDRLRGVRTALRRAVLLCSALFGVSELRFLGEQSGAYCDPDRNNGSDPHDVVPLHPIHFQRPHFAAVGNDVFIGVLGACGVGLWIMAGSVEAAPHCRTNGSRHNIDNNSYVCVICRKDQMGGSYCSRNFKSLDKAKQASGQRHRINARA